ncbi:hypothetical protein WFA24289_01859 [Periweissella fabaria]|uniref:CAAX prenyl protease 2/Lysostaphin resistance protein A-like domain-containing protein n=1 Tax=Periweissella fabaria TaxID=546157 RepID=A0ABM8Z7W4_9LACO|nr:hypothetical protein WFA24289_01859 [Periweissella fabaria]
MAVLVSMWKLNKQILYITFVIIVVSIISDSIIPITFWIFVFLVIKYKAFIPNKNQSLILFIIRRLLYITFFALPILLIDKFNFYIFPINYCYFLVSVVLALTLHFLDFRQIMNIPISTLLLSVKPRKHDSTLLVESIFIFFNSISEEILFRLFVLHSIACPIFQVLVSTIIFIAIHNRAIFTSNSQKIKMQTLPIYVVFNLTVWIMYYATQSLLYPIIIHFLFNLPTLWMYSRAYVLKKK